MEEYGNNFLLTNSLYIVQYAYAMILLVLMLVISLAFYKRSLKDNIVLMILSGVFECAFECLCTIVMLPDAPIIPLIYLVVCGYGIFLIAYFVFMNCFLDNQLFAESSNKHLIKLLNYVPFGVFLLLCISTPWTHLLFDIQEDGTAYETIPAFTVLLLFYCIFSIGKVIYCLIAERENHDVFIQAKYLLVFVLMVPAVFVFQSVTISIFTNEDYTSQCWNIALPLVYLTTVTNTLSLLDSRAKMEAVESDLRIASNIQMTALPDASPEFFRPMRMDLYASMNTAKEVGGDFFDYYPIDDHRFCFLISDVSGKGTPAALFMMTTKTLIKCHAQHFDNTADIFTKANRDLSENNAAGMFATAWIGIFDNDTRMLQYTNAGHNYPVIKRKGQPAEYLKKRHGLFLAGMDDTEYRKTEIEMHEGDRLVLYTDGITEAHDPDNQMYGEDRLLRLVDETAEESGKEVSRRIFEDVNRFANGAPQFDDMTILIVSFK